MHCTLLCMRHAERENKSISIASVIDANRKYTCGALLYGRTYILLLHTTGISRVMANVKRMNFAWISILDDRRTRKLLKVNGKCYVSVSNRINTHAYVVHTHLQPAHSATNSLQVSQNQSTAWQTMAPMHGHRKNNILFPLSLPNFSSLRAPTFPRSFHFFIFLYCKIQITFSFAPCFCEDKIQ